MPRVVLPTLHAGQVSAFRCKTDARGGEWDANAGKKRVALRCGRRWGKTTYAGVRVSDGAAKGRSMGWFSPDYKRLTEAYQEIKGILRPVIEVANKTEGVIRTTTGGRIDFWTLNDESAGRSRFYHGVVVDEGAFTKNGAIEDPTAMLSIWEKAIEPTLFDYGGWALVASNTNGVDPDNFLYAICNDPKWGFVSYHAPTISNPLLPMRKPGESDEQHMARRIEAIEAIRATKHPLVFKQEYEAEFIDWSGVAFFDRDKLLDNGLPVDFPSHCDGVFAVVDTATKTGAGNDGTAVTYFARNLHAGFPLVILDWDILQIEGDLLEEWLPSVFRRLEELAGECGARMGSMGTWIEDKSSGMVLLQKMLRNKQPVHAIPGALTAMGKDERAIAVSDHHYNGRVKITRHAFDKTTAYKGSTRNHYLSQVTGFRIGDKDSAKRADDLLDTHTYGIALSLGNGEGV